MRELKYLSAILLALIMSLALTAAPYSTFSNVLGTTALAQEEDAEEEDWDDWDDWDEEEGEEEDAFGNIMETSFTTIDEVTFDAPGAGAACKVAAKITLEDEEEEATIASVELLYSVDGGALASVAMAAGEVDEFGSGSYEGEIPGQAAGAKVAFFVKATDSNENVTTGALPGADMVVSGVDDMDNSEDIVGDDADLLNLSAGYDDENLYVSYSVQGEIKGGTIDPPYIQLYGAKFTNPDTETGEGLMVGKLWVYLPLAKEKEVQDKFMPMLMDQGQEYIEQIGQENIDNVMNTGMMVLDIQKLMGGNIMEGLLFSAEPSGTVEGGVFKGQIKRAALGENPSGYIRIITLTAANASIDSFMPIPLNCSNFLTIYTSSYSYEVK